MSAHGRLFNSFAAGPTSLFTDHYELTMVAAALADGTAARQLRVRGLRPPAARGPPLRRGRGHGRLLEAIDRFRFGEDELARLSGVVGAPMLDWLADYRFSGDVDGYPEGELYFPGSPIVSVSGTFADAVVLETLVLSILNHDCAVAAAARGWSGRRGASTDRDGVAAHPRGGGGRGGPRGVPRRVLRDVEPGVRRRYGIPTAGTAAHA